MRRFANVLSLIALGACATVPRQPNELRLYVFDCGWAKLATVAPFGVADHETSVREAPFPCYLIEHPRGRLLWDGGIGSSFARKGWSEVQPGLAVRIDRTLASQLGDLGLTLDSIDFVAFSHLHWDHAGIANELRAPTLIIQQAEYDAAFAPAVTVPAFDTAVYAGLRTLKRRTIVGDHDVFGDGRVRIISAPGHTPGHQVLLVKLAQTGPVVLSGDLYHFRVSRERRRVPTFNVDSAQSVRSMDRVETLLRQEGATLWIHHDPELFASLRKAPAYYR